MTFQETLQNLIPHGDGWSMRVPEDWAVGRTTFGGMQTAIAVAAARKRVSADIPLRSVQTTFVGPVIPGQQIQVYANKLRTGKSVSHIEVRLMQDQLTLCLLTVVFGAARESALRFDRSAPQVSADPGASQAWPTDPVGHFPFQAHFEQRWVPGCIPGSGLSEPRTSIWLRSVDHEPLSESHVIAFADVPPTPALSALNRWAQGASLIWMLELLDHDFSFDPDAFWRMDMNIFAGRDGYYAQDAVLWNPAGRAAALSRQTAMVFEK
ncbi:MAG: acyl-CoA thioesterase [Panacagrimonas sp.]